MWTQEALAINTDDLPTLASRCQTVASANVCAPNMLAGDSAGNAI
jgi:hypothetical protein